MKKQTSSSSESALDLLEEAVHLLRGAPLSLYSSYAVGTLPFVLAFLYFWADMSRGAFARDHLGTGACAMGLLFLWMKCWQAAFSTGLRSQRTGQACPPWSARRVGWLVLNQSALQPSGLFFIPAMVVVMIPFAWVFAFYQNLTVMGADGRSLRQAWGNAAGQAGTRSAQNHFLVGFLAIFTLFVWLNVATAMGWLPYLLKTLFGIDTAFTQAGAKSFFNTTYVACSFALTYLCVDPLIKAVYTLRCFYGQSLKTGDDMKADLASVRGGASTIPVLLAALVLFGVATPIFAAPAPETATAVRPISASDLNRSIDEVLQRPEFAWRMPREAERQVDEQTTWYSRALDSAVDILRDLAKYCVKSIEKMWKWLEALMKKLWPSSEPGEPNFTGLASGWTSFLQIVLLILIVLITGLLTVLIIRLWRRRRQTVDATASVVAIAPDLTDENIGADQLPEDGWLKLAQEMMAQGNLRLALRAFYLAGLASLAAREMIAIASFKSNREYEMELRRRARILPAAQTAFSQNVAAFDRAWYGRHEVSLETLHEFQTNLEQIRAC
jgi:hypothetical protein